MSINLQNLENEITGEINNFRENPGLYITYLEKAKSYYHEKEYRNPDIDFNILTEEGITPVDEILKILKSQKKLQKLKKNSDLSKIGEKLLKHIGPNGKTTSDNEELRLDNRTKNIFTKEGEIGENLNFGCNTGKEVVIQMLIDDGVKKRGHRLNLLNSDYNEFGVSCKEHTIYEVCSSIVFFGPSKLNENIFDKYVIKESQWPKDCLSLRKYVEVRTVQGIKIIKVKYVFKMEEGKDVVVEKDFEES